jgi:hypothetical protein
MEFYSRAVAKRSIKNTESDVESDGKEDQLLSAGRDPGISDRHMRRLPESTSRKAKKISSFIRVPSIEIVIAKALYRRTDTYRSSKPIGSVDGVECSFLRQ